MHFTVWGNNIIVTTTNNDGHNWVNIFAVSMYGGDKPFMSQFVSINILPIRHDPISLLNKLGLGLLC